MPRPIILVVADDRTALRSVDRALRQRYARSYEIICVPSAGAALLQLNELQADAREVALVLADQWMSEMAGVLFLALAHARVPLAKRALLIAWGDGTMAKPVVQAMALGWIDCYVGKPASPHDEQFHQLITDFLADWTRLHRPRVLVQVVGDRWAPRSHESRDLLDRNGIASTFIDRDSAEGRTLLTRVQHPDGPFPVLILSDGRVLADPSNTEVASALGARTRPTPEMYDAII
ncbi:MAG TPA: hypothetical protein VEZ12_10075, partial [Herpetosiphonaceae bacterium]|nr:hypothetical protein [Herpetosiphonaceae bacterium]